jgi:hypothetical protein
MIVNPTTFRQQTFRAAPGTASPNYVVSQQQPQRRTQWRVTDYKLEENVPCAVTEDTALMQNEFYSSAHAVNMITSSDLPWALGVVVG